jgi:hypothetical protein
MKSINKSKNTKVSIEKISQIHISALNDSVMLILEFLDPMGLLALSRTGKNYRKLFNNKYLLNRLRDIHNDKMASISFVDGSIFLNDLAILVDLIKLNQRSVGGNNQFKNGDRVTLSATLSFQCNKSLGPMRVMSFVDWLIMDGYGNYMVTNLRGNKMKLFPVNIHGEILPPIQLGNKSFEYIDGSIISRANIKAAVAKFKIQDNVRKKMVDKILEIVIVHGICMYMPYKNICRNTEYTEIFINKYPSMLIPYSDFKYTDPHNLITDSVSNKITDLDIYRMNEFLSVDNINTYTDITPLSEAFINATLMNKDGRRSTFTKIRNLADDTEIWKVIRSSDKTDIGMEYKVTLGYYANFLIAILNRQKNDIVELLKNINPSFSNNRSIIMACEKGYYEIVEILLRDNRIDPSVSNNRAIVVAENTSENFNITEMMLRDLRVDLSLTENILDNWAAKTILRSNIISRSGIYSLYVKFNKESEFIHLLENNGFYGKFLRHLIRYAAPSNMINIINSMTYIVNSGKFMAEHKIINDASLSVLYPKKIKEINNRILTEENEENINLYFSIRGFLLLTIFDYKDIIEILITEGASNKSIDMFSYLCAADFGYNKSIKHGIITARRYNIDIYGILGLLIK